MFDVLDEKTAIDRPLILEASAGTGKTFSIQHLVVRNLLRGVKLKEILVVTFTKASTKELKERILALLREIAAGNYPPYFPKTEEAKKCVQEALREFDGCEIDTIHAFAKRMLSTYAFEANLFVDQMQDEAPMDQEKLAAVRDFLRTDLEGLSYGLAQKKVLLDLNPEKLVKEKAAGSFLSFDQLYQQFAQLIERFPETINLVDAAPFFYKVADMDQIAEFQERLLAARPPSPETFDQLLFAPMQVLEHFSRRKKKGDDPPWLALFQEELTPLLEYALSKEILTKRFIYDLQPLILERTFEAGKLGFDEMLTGMQKSLHSSAFKAAVRSRYKTVLIDEFQDTDPIQWDIFSTLFLQEWDGVLYLVGDPKQSIYGFRNADIYTYLQACERLGPEAKATLDTNYRSHPNLVEEINRFFATDQLIPLPKIHAYLPYHPVLAGRVDPKEEGMRIDFFEADSLEASLADMTAKIQEKGGDKCCVLVKGKNQGREVAAYLKQYRVPHFFLRRVEWEENPMITQLKLFLKALQHPDDLNRLKALLGSRLGGFSSRELLDAPYNQLIALLKKIGVLGFFAAFRAFNRSSFCRSRLDQGEWEQLHKLIDMAGKRKDIELFLDRLYLGLEKEEDSIFNPKEMEGEGVAICTIHMSKGLEFSHVFAIGLSAPQKNDEKFEGHPEGVSIKEVMLNRQMEIKKQETESEWMRQLYVAMTRAKETLYLTLYQKKAPSILSYYLEKHPGKASFRTEGKLPDPHFIAPKKERPKKNPVSTRFEKKVHLIHSYTSLADEVEAPVLGALQPDELPRGKEVGIALHDLLERVPYKQLKTLVEMQTWVEGELRGSYLTKWSAYIADLFFTLFEMPLPFKLKEMSLVRECDFLFTSDQPEFTLDREEFLTGKIDALFTYQGKYYLIDWKTNWLSDYGPASLQQAMEASSYPLQARIYKKALQRTVEAIEKRDFEECFGGCLYIFLRGVPEGKGVILWK